MQQTSLVFICMKNHFISPHLCSKLLALRFFNRCSDWTFNGSDNADHTIDSGFKRSEPILRGFSELHQAIQGLNLFYAYMQMLCLGLRYDSSCIVNSVVPLLAFSFLIFEDSRSSRMLLKPTRNLCKSSATYTGQKNSGGIFGLRQILQATGFFVTIASLILTKIARDEI